MKILKIVIVFSMPIFAIFIGSVLKAEAAPAINNVLGIFTDGQTITVNGTGFNDVPAYKYKDFMDGWTEHVWNSAIPTVTSLGTVGGIAWTVGVNNNNRPAGISVDMGAIKRIDNRANYSTGYHISQGYWWDSTVVAGFEGNLKANFDGTDQDLWVSYYTKYGDEVTTWPDPYRENGSGKTVYFWLGDGGGRSNYVNIPEIVSCASGDCAFRAMTKIGPGRFVNNGLGMSTPFTGLRGKWVQQKVHYKANTFTAWLDIISISRATSGVVTVETATPHGIIVGDWINVKDCTTTAFNTITSYVSSPRYVTSTNDSTHLTYCNSIPGADPAVCSSSTMISGADGHISGAHQDGILQYWLGNVLKYDGRNISTVDYPTLPILRNLQFMGNHSGSGVAGDCEKINISDRRGAVCDWLPKMGTLSGAYPNSYYMIGGVEPVRYWDDIVADTSDPGWGTSFVYLSNQATWGSGPGDTINGDSNFVRQIVGGTNSTELGFKSWSDGQFKFKVNTAGLNTTQPVYLYIINWKGETNSSGYILNVKQGTTLAPPMGLKVK